MNTNDKNQKRGEEEELKIYGAPGSTLQTPEEHRHDQSVDPTKDTTIDVSNDDLRKTDIDRMKEQLDGKRGDTEIDDTLSNDE
ncbi:hypothetical protein [Flavisolibacter nicotianae]|uniref:hypothetical protein n=1 Tax=Flavisolibacter nicotianae TaxID=2364882 RepID=UPI000EB21177|nr:hypothetical protein [Flavisolibacter nicotianae]